jgi:hypothetical protein
MAIKGKRNSASFFAKARQTRNFVNGNLGYFLFRDNVPTICLAQWPMEATLWDGDLIAGPVPTLFTEEVEAGTKAILEVKNC